MATDDENDDLEREDDSPESHADDAGDDDSSVDDEGDDDSRADEPEASDEGADDEQADDDADEADDESDSDEEAAPERRVAARSKSDDEDEPAEDFDSRLPPVTSLLGVERWVQFAFIALGVVIFFVADEIIQLVWGSLGYTPDSTIASGSAALLGIISAFLLYRDARVNDMAHEVASELSKVSWPSREETYYSTIIVLVTSVVAALYTGVFDALWSAFTDLIYNVRA